MSRRPEAPLREVAIPRLSVICLHSPAPPLPAGRQARWLAIVLEAARYHDVDRSGLQLSQHLGQKPLILREVPLHYSQIRGAR
jgi:hypothetical protein